MNTPSTALTRPRSEFGVASATVVARMFIEIMSTKPLTASASAETRNQRDRPKTTMLAPKAPTTRSSVRPALPPSGLRASRMPAISAPTAIALLSTPRPSGPVCRIDFAKSGSSATAPPKSTAKRSRVIAPRTIGVARIRRIPPSRLSSRGGSGPTRRATSGPETRRSSSDEATSSTMPVA